MNTSKERWLWEVVPHAYAFGLLGWKVTRRTDEHTRKMCVFSNKLDAVLFAVDQCNYWAKKDQPSELKIKNKWNRIQDSRTYLYDPPNIKG